MRLCGIPRVAVACWAGLLIPPSSAQGTSGPSRPTPTPAASPRPRPADRGEGVTDLVLAQSCFLTAAAAAGSPRPQQRERPPTSPSAGEGPLVAPLIPTFSAQGTSGPSRPTPAPAASPRPRPADRGEGVTDIAAR